MPSILRQDLVLEQYLEVLVYFDTVDIPKWNIFTTTSLYYKIQTMSRGKLNKKLVVIQKILSILANTIKENMIIVMNKIR